VEGGADAVLVGAGVGEAATLAVSLLAVGLLIDEVEVEEASGVYGALLVVAACEVATGSLLTGAAGEGVEVVATGAGDSTALVRLLLAVAFDVVVATFASSTLDEALLVRVGSGAGVGVGSATFAVDSLAVGEVGAETSAGVALGATESALLAVRVAGACTLISLSFTL